jgi:hypothetical protein
MKQLALVTVRSVLKHHQFMYYMCTVMLYGLSHMCICGYHDAIDCVWYVAKQNTG